MKTIMLIGKSNSGKTTTLTQVRDELYHLGAIDLCKPTLIGTPKPNKPDDFECILDYKGQKIAIYTMGDDSDDVLNAISKYELRCDILLIANRVKYEEPLKKVLDYPNSLVLVKTPKSNQDSQIIVSLIDLII